MRVDLEDARGVESDLWKCAPVLASLRPELTALAVAIRLTLCHIVGGPCKEMGICWIPQGPTQLRWRAGYVVNWRLGSRVR